MTTSDFTLTAAPVQQGLFLPSSYEKKAEPVVVIIDERQREMFAAKENEMQFPTDKRGALTPIDLEQYEYMRDTLPPIVAKGCLGMGEPYSHDSDGTPTYHWAGKIGTDYFMCFGTQAEAEAAFRAGVLT